MFGRVLLLFALLYIAHAKSISEKNKKAAGDDDENTLVMIHVVFRHGDRTPDVTTVYPTDPYINETYYPYGKGELTLQGKKRSFAAGEFLRKRYKQFLSGGYDYEILDGYSSSYGRTQMSLQAVQTALFPPDKTQEIKGNLQWQPIPYTYLSQKDDNLIATYRSCDLLYYITDDIEKTEEYQEILKSHKKLYEYLSEHSGWKVNNTKLSFFIYNTLKTEGEWGLTPPEWTKEIYPNPLQSAAAWFWKLVSSTVELRKIAIGNILKKITLDSMAKSDGTLKPSGRKVYLYSGHDFNVIPMMAALGHYNGEELPYSSQIIFELHKINGAFGFKVFFKGDEEEPRQLKVLDCEEFCPLQMFHDMYEDHFPGENWCSTTPKTEET